MGIIAVLLIISALVWIEISLYRRYGLKGVEYTVRLSTDEAYEGDEIEIIEEVSNKKALPVLWLKSELSTSRWLDFIGTKTNRAVESRFVPSIFMLKPYQKCTRRRRVICVKRGIFKLEDTTLVVCDFFGFVLDSKKIYVDSQITVLPTGLEVQPPVLSSERFFGENEVRRFVCEDPFIISGVREYRGYEPLNKIHWKSTARTGELMVVNNQFTADNNILIAINFQRGESGGLAPAKESDIEGFIKTAAFFLYESTKRGFKTSLMTNSKSGLKPREPQNTPSYCHQMLRALAGLQNECYEDFAGLFGKTNAEAFTDIIILTPYTGERLTKAIRKLAESGINTIVYCRENGNFDGGGYVQVLQAAGYSHLSLLGLNEEAV